jgi:hypothetical protein
MAKQKKVAVEAVEPYLEGVAKSLVDRLYGPKGPPGGTRMTELEDVVIAVREALSEKMLAQALQRQAATAEERPEPFQRCSGCQGPVEGRAEPEPRHVQTRAGEAAWEEPHCYCRKCRQVFFPSSFVPILDFIHVLSYVFAAALAGRKFAEGWSIYQQWIGWVWSGEVSRVIAALAERQLELGAPAADESATSPRQVVARALAYLQNHQEQMRYPEYRRLGLPITSSYVESAVKQFNQRVKGTEKF